MAPYDSAIPEAPGLGEVEAYRQWFRNHVQPAGYSPTLHALLHLGPLIAVCAIAVLRLSDVTWWQWSVAPVMLLVGSAFVYWFHRHVLHRPRRWAFMPYERHTLQHHRFFDYEHITLEEPGDWYVTLFPWWAGSILAVLSIAVGFALTPVLGHNAASLLMLMMPLYMLLYEAVHSISHLPDTNLLTRMPVLRFLREHHRLHHEPRLMGKHNFNVVIPLFDAILGALTTERPGR